MRNQWLAFIACMFLGAMPAFAQSSDFTETTKYATSLKTLGKLKTCNLAYQIITFINGKYECRDNYKLQCSASQTLRGMDTDGNPICDDNYKGASCDPGTAFTGFDTNGNKKCQPYTAIPPTCGPMQVLTSKPDGTGWECKNIGESHVIPILTLQGVYGPCTAASAMTPAPQGTETSDWISQTGGLHWIHVYSMECKFACHEWCKAKADFNDGTLVDYDMIGQNARCLCIR